MPDDVKPAPPSSQPSATPQALASQSHAGHIPITEELDSAKWTLPPIVPLLVAAAIVAIVVVVIVFSNRTNPSASMVITKIAAADQYGNTMAAVQVKIDNVIPKALWIKNISAEVETPDGKKYEDHAAPAVDAPRYMQAFPPLEAAKADWLREELKIPAKTSFSGVAIFAYPITKEVFDGRKSLTIRIQFYDEPTLVVVSTP